MIKTLKSSVYSKFFLSKILIIIFTITITGLVLIFFARAAYLNVLIVSLAFDLAGDMHAIYIHKL